MYYVITDIEWNGAFSKKANGYFNELIEIGAVMLDEHLVNVDTFHALIKPVVSKKLSNIVTGMSSIRSEELAQGITFAGALAAFKRWIGNRSHTFITWSTTDLLVWIENCQYFLGNRRLPFMDHFLDAQAYCMRRLGHPPNQQLGLKAAAGIVGIDCEGSDLHRALDDALLTAQVFCRLYAEQSVLDTISITDNVFYNRLTFKARYITTLSDPLADPAELVFRCMNCDGMLEQLKEWRIRSRHFTAVFVCRHCDKFFHAKVRFKITFDGLVVRRRLDEFNNEEEPTHEQQKPD